MPSPLALGAVVALSLQSTALAYLLYFRVLATAGATNTLLVTFMMPVSAILLGTLILHERLLPRHLIGMLIIFIGLAVIDGRVLRYVMAKLRPHPEAT
jgi:drug/metabolite transporter (DMT)-like permease